jgi:hypothetical protein
VTGPTGSAGPTGDAYPLATVLSSGAGANETGGTNLLVTVGDRIDAASAGVLNIGTVTATSVVIGASPVSIPGRLAVGPTALATTDGDFAAGDPANESELVFDESERTLSLLPVTTSDDCVMRVGETGAGTGRFTATTNGTSLVTLRAINGGSGGSGNPLAIRGGDPGAFGSNIGGEINMFAGDGESDGVASRNGGTVSMAGGVASIFGSPDTLGATFVLSGGAVSPNRGGNGFLTGGNGSDGFSTGRPGGSASVIGGTAGAGGDGGDLFFFSGGNTGGGTAGDVTLDAGGTGTVLNNIFIGNTNADEVSFGRSAGLHGFFGAPAVARSAAYSRTAAVVGTRMLSSSAAATPTNTNNVLAAVIQDLQAIGLIG